MNREEIVRMARIAVNGRSAKTLAETQSLIGLDEVERFADLVAAAERDSWPAEMEAMERQVNILTDALAQAKAEEREACAKVCDEYSAVGKIEEFDRGWLACAKAISNIIRARGQL